MKGHSYVFVLSAIMGIACLSCGNKTDSSSGNQTVKVHTGNITHEVGIHIPADMDKNRSYPAIYMMDDELFNNDKFIFRIDSLTYIGKMQPAFLVAVDDINADLINEVGNHINAGVRFFYGNGTGADSGIQFSASATKDLFKEYWCFNPSPVNVNANTLSGTKYRIVWNLKNNTEAYYDKYPAFVYSLRKRGATIIESTYSDYEDLPSRMTEFLHTMAEVLPAQAAR